MMWDCMQITQLRVKQKNKIKVKLSTEFKDNMMMDFCIKYCSWQISSIIKCAISVNVHEDKYSQMSEWREVNKEWNKDTEKIMFVWSTDLGRDVQAKQKKGKKAFHWIWRRNS